jgi:hypothetical protein
MRKKSKKVKIARIKPIKKFNELKQSPGRTSNIKHFINPIDKVIFYYVVIYKPTNVFITFYFSNGRVNKNFILKKMSCGYRFRDTYRYRTSETNLNVQNRNKYKLYLNFVKRSIRKFNREIVSFFSKRLELKEYPFMIINKLYALDFRVYELIKRVSLSKMLTKFRMICLKKIKKVKKNIIKSIKGKVLNIQKEKEILFPTIFEYFYIKKSYNGCKISKGRFLKKKRVKKAKRKVNPHITAYIDSKFY